MKTRSNMPLFVVETNNVKALSNSQIDLLRCGDYLVKKDESGEHAYKVTFKSDTGMCITYHDASVIETQSYDKVDGNWVYNSEDKSEITTEYFQELMEQGEPMSNYRYAITDQTPVFEKNVIYAGAVKNGNKLTLVVYARIKRTDTASGRLDLGTFAIPKDVGAKLYPISLFGEQVLLARNENVINETTGTANLLLIVKKAEDTPTNSYVGLSFGTNSLSYLTLDVEYIARVEITFLLSDNLMPEQAGE